MSSDPVWSCDWLGKTNGISHWLIDQMWERFDETIHVAVIPLTAAELRLAPALAALYVQAGYHPLFLHFFQSIEEHSRDKVQHKDVTAATLHMGGFILLLPALCAYTSELHVPHLNMEWVAAVLAVSGGLNWGTADANPFILLEGEPIFERPSVQAERVYVFVPLSASPSIPLQLGRRQQHTNSSVELVQREFIGTLGVAAQLSTWQRIEFSIPDSVEYECNSTGTTVTVRRGASVLSRVSRSSDNSYTLFTSSHSTSVAITLVWWNTSVQASALHHSLLPCIHALQSAAQLCMISLLHAATNDLPVSFTPVPDVELHNITQLFRDMVRPALSFTTTPSHLSLWNPSVSPLAVDPYNGRAILRVLDTFYGFRPAPRVLFWMATGEQLIPTRIRDVASSWLTPDVLIFTRGDLSQINHTFQELLPAELDAEPSERQVLKFMGAWSLLFERYLEQYDYFIKVDDDTYLRPELLTYHIASGEWENREAMLRTRHAIYSLPNCVTEGSVLCYGAGAVYGFSRRLLAIAGPLFDNNNSDSCVFESMARPDGLIWEDRSIGRCLLQHNLMPVDQAEQQPVRFTPVHLMPSAPFCAAYAASSVAVTPRFVVQNPAMSLFRSWRPDAIVHTTPYARSDLERQTQSTRVSPTEKHNRHGRIADYSMFWIHKMLGEEMRRQGRCAAMGT